jgi:hypothetical protein
VVHATVELKNARGRKIVRDYIHKVFIPIFERGEGEGEGRGRV